MLQRIPPTLRGRNVALAVKRCIVCREDFECPDSLAGRYSTCSPQCTSANRRGEPVVLTCLECGGEFTPGNKGAKGRGAKFCSNPCRMAALQRIPRSMKDRGEGWLDSEGHVVVAVWRNGQRRVTSRARLVVSALIGRELASTEVVHHINLIPDDDRPVNLWLCRDQAEHMRLHAFTRRLQASNLITLPQEPGGQPAGGREDKVVGSQQKIIQANDVLGRMRNLDPGDMMRLPVVTEDDVADLHGIDSAG